MKRPLSRMVGPSKFRIGLFGMNCSNGMCMTTAPEHWDCSWDNNVTAAKMADEAGFDFLLPIGRWHGYKGVTDTEGSTFETITWPQDFSRRHSASRSARRCMCVLQTRFSPQSRWSQPITSAKGDLR